MKRLTVKDLRKAMLSLNFQCIASVDVISDEQLLQYNLNDNSYASRGQYVGIINALNKALKTNVPEELYNVVPDGTVKLFINVFNQYVDYRFEIVNSGNTMKNGPF